MGTIDPIGTHFLSEGESADVCPEVETYHAWLLALPVLKLLFHATPGWSVTPEKAAWYTARPTNCLVGDIGLGVHYFHGDNPTLIGRESSARIAEQA